jgi:hypothetical protein
MDKFAIHFFEHTSKQEIRSEIFAFFSLSLFPKQKFICLKEKYFAYIKRYKQAKNNKHLLINHRKILHMCTHPYKFVRDSRR